MTVLNPLDSSEGIDLDALAAVFWGIGRQAASLARASTLAPSARTTARNIGHSPGVRSKPPICRRSLPSTWVTDSRQPRPRPGPLGSHATPLRRSHRLGAAPARPREPHADAQEVRTVHPQQRRPRPGGAGGHGVRDATPSDPVSLDLEKVRVGGPPHAGPTPTHPGVGTPTLHTRWLDFVGVWCSGWCNQ